ncbi:MAG: hypothetical protein J0I77_01960 [Rudaea sp.]|uniref:hypothetical protein n=1 Tax=unclassified Rudaea TaxID=2627037 RepID=UPI0010F6DD1D|nr:MULTISPECIES: hypothetical protein [unclassified Rudaea]MBN8884460.1 hypothetical protein [Rudaea sp.]
MKSEARTFNVKSVGTDFLQISSSDLLFAFEQLERGGLPVRVVFSQATEDSAFRPSSPLSKGLVAALRSDPSLANKRRRKELVALVNRDAGPFTKGQVTVRLNRLKVTAKGEQHLFGDPVKHRTPAPPGLLLGGVV